MNVHSPSCGVPFIEPFRVELGSEPLVSFVILTRDRVDDLIICLDSLGRQEWTNSEIIVVDNGSIDATLSVLSEHYQEVRVISLEENVGVCAGRNRGFEVARGSICIVLDDDASLEDPLATRKVVETFGADAKVAVLALTVVCARTARPEFAAIPRRDKVVMRATTDCTYFSGAGFAVLREVFVNLGKFWEPLFYGGEELDFSYRVIGAGYRIRWLSSVKVVHRRTSNLTKHEMKLFSAVRNRCWIATRNLPLPCALTTTLLWWTYGACVAVCTGRFDVYVRAIGEALTGLPEMLRSRQPVTWRQAGYMQRLSGRVWY